MKRLLYGGTFDPIHAGHVAMALTGGKALGADRVVLIPTHVPPHKQGQTHAGPEHRLAMTRLAASEHALLETADDEIRRAGPSYTFDTVRDLQEGRFQGDSLILLLGQDSLPLLPDWYRVRELADRIPIAVVPRRGAPEPDWESLATALGPGNVERMRRLWLPVPEVDVSSTDVRKRLEEGRSIRCRVPDPVCDYIEAHGLYRPADAAR